MNRALPLVTLLAATRLLPAATLDIDVRDGRGAAVAEAVVYAVPEGRSISPVRRTAVMDQRNRTFVPHILAVQTGTAVRFPNSDSIRHQVYSFSSPKTFQLPLYTGMPANPIVFDQPGVVSLGCNIHDKMSAYIVVVDTPHFGVTGRQGRVTLQDLSAGKYVVHFWHPASDADPAVLPIALAATDRRELKFVTR
jgi:plastocyanin